jgi:hypothetical protein
LWIISVGFDITDQPLIKLYAFARYWREKEECNETVHQLFIDFKKPHDSVRRKVSTIFSQSFGYP